MCTDFKGRIVVIVSVLISFLKLFALHQKYPYFTNKFARDCNL